MCLRPATVTVTAGGEYIAGCRRRVHGMGSRYAMYDTHTHSRTYICTEHTYSTYARASRTRLPMPDARRVKNGSRALKTSPHQQTSERSSRRKRQRRLTTVVCVVRPKQAGTRTHWWVQNCRDQAACPLSLLAAGRLTKVEQGHCPDDVRYASHARKQIARVRRLKSTRAVALARPGRLRRSKRPASNARQPGVRRWARASSRQVLALL